MQRSRAVGVLFLFLAGFCTLFGRPPLPDTSSVGEAGFVDTPRDGVLVPGPSSGNVSTTPAVVRPNSLQTPMLQKDCSERSNRSKLAKVVIRNKGWGMDVNSVVSAIYKAWVDGSGVQITILKGGWHYAVGYTKNPDPRKQGSPKRPPPSNAVCPARDLSCFFKPINCTAPVKKPTPIQASTLGLRPHDWLVQEAERRAAFAQLTEPCAVVHVRRSDVLLNFGFGQKSSVPLYRYVPLVEYSEEGTSALKRWGVRNIFLITDSASAIAEVAQLPEQHRKGYVIRYLDRPRFNGSEGGWENHFPSGSPKEEVIWIMTIASLVPRCHVWIGTESSFGTFMRVRMPNLKMTVMIKNSNPTAT
mmetsp:Transcript_91746/g.259009  ORF Transcript_91746/g.259009 Transcript_91746/m.259009 type:complete len:359 (+) Transcript_91746:177-1253(+)